MNGTPELLWLSVITLGVLVLGGMMFLRNDAVSGAARPVPIAPDGLRG
jgi:hypothetical protein